MQLVGHRVFSVMWFQHCAWIRCLTLLLTQAFCSMVILPVFGSCDPVIHGEEFYLKGVSVRWLSCNTLYISTFFAMDRHIPFIQLYGQFLNVHIQLQFFSKI